MGLVSVIIGLSNSKNNGSLSIYAFWPYSERLELCATNMDSVPGRMPRAK